VKYSELKVGDTFDMGGVEAVVLAVHEYHPINPVFMLVVWYIFGENRLSFDMLHPHYDLPDGMTVVGRGRLTRWKEAVDKVHGR
jgi:hypothetical protein